MVKQIAQEIQDAITGLPVAGTANLRVVRKAFSKKIASLRAKEVIALAKLLIRKYQVPHFFGYELIQHHRAAAEELNAKELNDLARDLDSWWTVDAFACYLSGVAWRNGQVSDAFVQKWARSRNVWIRRAALVSTVPLNNKARGGSGDTVRSLALCEMLVDDREDMVVKALSWALRELGKRDPGAVRTFLDKHDEALASRVRREVNTKLTTGLKSSRSKTNPVTQTKVSR